MNLPILLAMLLAAQEIIVPLPDHEREVVIEPTGKMDVATLERGAREMFASQKILDLEAPMGPTFGKEPPIRLRDVAKVSVRPLTSLPDADVKDLAERLFHAKPEVRTAARQEVWALRGRARGLVPLFLPRLKSAKGWEQEFDILFPLSALGPHGAAAIPLLVERLESAEPLDKMRYSDALAAIGAPAVPELRRLMLEGGAWTSRQAARALTKIGAPGEEILRQALSHESAAVRKSAAEGLKNAKERENIAPLVARLGDVVAEVRITAAYSLWNYGPAAREALPALLKMLDSPAADEERAAAATLGSIHAEPATVVPRLVLLLKSDDERLRSTIVTSLTRFGPQAAPAVPYLPEMLERAEPYRREEVLDLVAAIGPAAAPCLESVRTLLKSIKEDSPLNDQALKALAGMGPAALPGIDLILERAERSAEARRALASIGPAARKGLPAMTRGLFAYGSATFPPRWAHRYMAAIDLDAAAEALEKDLRARPEQNTFKMADYRSYGVKELGVLKARIRDLEKRLAAVEGEEILQAEFPNDFAIFNLPFVRAGDSLERTVALLGVPPRIQKGMLVYDVKGTYLRADQVGELRITLKDGKVFDRVLTPW